jgi:hypothetical protein
VFVQDDVNIYNHDGQIGGYGTVKGRNGTYGTLVDVVVAAPGFVAEGTRFGPDGDEKEIVLHPSFLDPRLPRRAVVKLRAQALTRDQQRGCFSAACLAFERRVLEHDPRHLREDWTGLHVRGTGRDDVALAANWREMVVHFRATSAEKARMLLANLAATSSSSSNSNNHRGGDDDDNNNPTHASNGQNGQNGPRNGRWPATNLASNNSDNHTHSSSTEQRTKRTTRVVDEQDHR